MTNGHPQGADPGASAPRSGAKFTAPNGTVAIKDGIKTGASVPNAPAAGGRKPPWLRVRLAGGGKYDAVRRTVTEHRLATVCEESHCPNIGECWANGTATIMLMGSVCTRACRFCSVDTGNPKGWLDPDEPAHAARSVALMNLKYVVLTSVDRDDLADGGAAHYAACIRAIRAQNPQTAVEALTPDFGGSEAAVATVVDAGLQVFAQNLETVERLTAQVRDPRAGYRQTLAVLRFAKRHAPDVLTKSSLMVGLGERDDEVHAAMEALRAHDVDLLTLGQYLRPTANHLPVQRWVTPEQFDRYRDWGLALGFTEGRVRTARALQLSRGPHPRWHQPRPRRYAPFACGHHPAAPSDLGKTMQTFTLSLAELLALGIVLLVLGLLTGLALGRTSLRSQQTKDLEAKLDTAQNALSDYRAEVFDQYAETARKFERLNESYNDLHRHLASSATTLLGDGISTPLLQGPDDPPVEKAVDDAPEATVEVAPELAETEATSATESDRAEAAEDGTTAEPVERTEATIAQTDSAEMDSDAPTLDSAPEATVEPIPEPAPAPAVAGRRDRGATGRSTLRREKRRQRDPGGTLTPKHRSRSAPEPHGGESAATSRPAAGGLGDVAVLLPRGEAR